MSTMARLLQNFTTRRPRRVSSTRRRVAAPPPTVARRGQWTETPFGGAMTLVPNPALAQRPTPVRRPTLSLGAALGRQVSAKLDELEAVYQQVKAERTSYNRDILRRQNPASVLDTLAQRIAAAEGKAATSMHAVNQLASRARASKDGDVPIVAVVDGPVRFTHIAPDDFMPDYFDPVEFAIANARSVERLTAADNEGSSSAGQADTDLAPSAGYEARVTVLKCQIIGDSDEPGTIGGTIAVDYYDDLTSQFGPGAQIHEVDETVTYAGGKEESSAGVALAKNSDIDLIFDHPGRGMSTFYVHLCMRPASLSKVVPAVALLGTAITPDTHFDALYTSRNLTVDWRALGGSNINVRVEAVFPSSQGWDEYVDFAEEQGWTS